MAIWGPCAWLEVWPCSPLLFVLFANSCSPLEKIVKMVCLRHISACCVTRSLSGSCSRHTLLVCLGCAGRLSQVYFWRCLDVLAVCLRHTPSPDRTNIMAPPAQGRRGLIRGTTLFPEPSGLPGYAGCACIFAVLAAMLQEFRRTGSLGYNGPFRSIVSD